MKFPNSKRKLLRRNACWRWPGESLLLLLCLVSLPGAMLTTSAQATRQTTTFRRIKSTLDSVAAIDTHDHLPPFSQLHDYVQTEYGRGMNLFGLWKGSYFTRTNPLTLWQPGGPFSEWWDRAKADFENARGTSFYRYMLPAFLDLYGIDFEQLNDAQARDLDRRIFEKYRDQKWLYHVITERANIELMFNDPYWARLDLQTYYPFGILVFNVTTLVRGFHPTEFLSPSDFSKPFDDPFRFAKDRGLIVKSFDAYLDLLDRMFQEAKEKGAVCLKSTLAYQRTLEFDQVSKERAALVFGRARQDLTAGEVKSFEDFIMWRLVELSAKYSLPFQIHTGDARIQGSSPMHLVELIAANPKTQFILFHGGFPWVGETGAIVMKHTSHVWIDSVWLPTLSYTMAKRAFHEWLDVVPSNRIMWGADGHNIEEIYAATEVTRRCLAEVLAEKVDSGDLAEKDALRIGKQILRDNALELFPQLKGRLWKQRGKLLPP